MKWWIVGGCLVTAYVVIPASVYWLRHRPHRLTRSTLHIVLAGQLAQLVVVVVALLLWWLA